MGKDIKKMLLGISFILVAVCCAAMLNVDSEFTAYVATFGVPAFLLLGLGFSFTGYLDKNNKV